MCAVLSHEVYDNLLCSNRKTNINVEIGNTGRYTRYKIHTHTHTRVPMISYCCGDSASLEDYGREGQ